MEPYRVERVGVDLAVDPNRARDDAVRWGSQRDRVVQPRHAGLGGIRRLLAGAESAVTNRREYLPLDILNVFLFMVELVGGGRD